MTRGDQYRKLAADFRARAAKETAWPIKNDLRSLARGYDRLAEQADRNSEPKEGIFYETPERPAKPGAVSA